MTRERSKEDIEANEAVKKAFLELEQAAIEDQQYIPERWEEMRKRLRACGIEV